MAWETATERILKSMQEEASPEAVETLLNAAEKNPLINEYLEEIAGHNYFAADYQKIIDAMDMAMRFNISDRDTLSVILRPDINPKLMEDAIFSINEGVPLDDIKFAYDSIETGINEYGLTKEEAEGNAIDIMVCRRNGIGHDTLTNDELQANSFYTAEQIHAFAGLSYRISCFAEEKADDNKRIDNLSSDSYDPDYLNNRILSTALLQAGCYDETNTPAQIKAIGQSVIEYFNQKEWGGIFSNSDFDNLKTINYAIVSHKSYSAVYDNIVHGVPYESDTTPEEIWTKAKERTVNQEILYSRDAVDNDDPIAGLKRICEGVGLSSNDTDKLIEAAEPLIYQNDFLKEHDSENVDIRLMADMVIEGIPPEDIPDYINVIGHNRESLESLYECHNVDLPKEVTINCITEKLNHTQLNEVFAGKENGLANEKLMDLAVNESPVVLCKMRLKMQTQNDLEKASVMTDEKPELNTVEQKVKYLKENKVSKEFSSKTVKSAELSKKESITEH